MSHLKLFCIGSSPFASIAWSQMATKSADFPYGLIAGGMLDGSIHIWDPSKLISNEKTTPEASVDQHKKAVHGLQFNPHKESSHLLASGGADGEVFILDVGRPTTSKYIHTISSTEHYETYGRDYTSRMEYPSGPYRCFFITKWFLYCLGFKTKETLVSIII